MVPVGLSPRGKSVALHRIAGAMISKEIYIKRKNVRTKRRKKKRIKVIRLFFVLGIIGFVFFILLSDIMKIKTIHVIGVNDAELEQQISEQLSGYMGDYT